MTQAKRSRLNPIGALVLTRERIQEVLDDAVERGRMTRDDAQELLAELGRRGTGPADRLIRAAGLGSAFPIDEYDDMTAAQVTDKLDGLAPAQLRTVRDHERSEEHTSELQSRVDIS